MIHNGNLPMQGARAMGQQLPMGASLQSQQNGPPKPPELTRPRFMNYYADYSGCGHWRMIWPEQVLNAHDKAVCHGTTVMNGDSRQYIQVKGVRVQRQATP